MTIGEYFQQLRDDENYHLGMGDIRLTKVMQDEIAAVADLMSKVLVLCNLVNLSMESDEEEDACLGWAWSELSSEWQEEMRFAFDATNKALQAAISFGEDEK